jgi:hypothetical protein
MERAPLLRPIVLCGLALLGVGCSPVEKAFAAINANDTTTLRAMAAEEGFGALIDTAGMTPLMLAAAQDRERIVQILVDAKTPMETTGRNGLTALGMAIGKGSLRSARVLLQAGANPRVIAGDPQPRLSDMSLCVHRKQFAACDLLLEHGLEIDFRGPASTTALQMAAFEGNVEGLDYLLGKGARCALKDVDSNAAVHLLLRGETKDRAPVLELLARKCPDWDLEIRDQAGNTPLIVAATEGDLESIRTLVRMGADLDARDEADHETALFTQHPEAVKLLLELGADPSLKNAAGSTPVASTLSLGWEESFRVLYDHQAADGPVSPGLNIRPLAFLALNDSRLSALTFLLDRGTDPSTADVFGHTLLDKALEEGQSEVAALLCSRGAKASDENADKARAAGCKIP